MASVHFPLTELNRTTDAVVSAIASRRQKILDNVGVQLLSLIRLDYIEKSHGNVGASGISWAHLKVGTILARLRKAGHLSSRAVKAEDQKASGHAKDSYLTPGKNASKTVRDRNQRTIYTVARSIKRNKELFHALAASGVVFYDKKGNKAKSSDMTKKGTVLSVSSRIRKSVVTLSPESYQIGVDTGAQLNSSQPGYDKGDGEGGNILTTDETSVTVGFGRSYSSHFDKHRKLIPDPLPPEWIAELEEQLADVEGKIINETLTQQGAT